MSNARFVSTLGDDLIKPISSDNKKNNSKKDVLKKVLRANLFEPLKFEKEK